MVANCDPIYTLKKGAAIPGGGSALSKDDIRVFKRDIVRGTLESGISHWDSRCLPNIIVAQTR